MSYTFIFLFRAILSSLNVAKASITIPPDFLEAGRPAAISLPELHSCGENPALPAQEVGCFFRFSSGVLLPPYVVCAMQN